MGGSSHLPTSYRVTALTCQYLSVAGRIKPGGLVKQMDEHLGKFVPTYIDVDPTEVSVTDHPANLGTFALAVTKSMPEGFMEKDATMVTNAHDSKPDEYKDVDTADFLDPEHFKYPVDERHLMPALRYFNQSGQRTAGGYSDAEWAAMGTKLASKLSSATGETYGYDEATETVTKHDTKKTNDVKEVNTTMNKGNLVSKHYSDDVKSVLAQFGKTVEEPKVEEAAATPEAPATPETPAPAAETTPATEQPAAAETPAAEGDVNKSSSTIESLLSDIASSLSTLTSDKSSTSTDSATGSDSSTSTPASNTSTTSTDKAADSAGTSSDDDDSSMESSLSSMGKAIETMKQLLAKRKSSTSVPTSTTSTPTSTSYPSSTSSTDTSSTTSKAFDDLTAVVLDIKKAVDELKARPQALPQRKGIAVAMEKKFEQADAQAFVEDPAIVAKLQTDQRAEFKDLHAYRAQGTLPAWFNAA